jgi:DNA processing protein
LRLQRQQRLELAPAAAPGPMSGFAEQVFSCLQVDKPVYLDELIERLPQLSSSEIIALLFELEEAGRIRQLPGRSYVKVWSE